MRKLGRLLLLFAVAALVVSCDNNPPPTLPPATPGGGFIIETFGFFSGLTEPVSEPNVEISANWVTDLAGAAGDPTSFTVVTDPDGLASAVGKRAPAQWKFTWVESADPDLNLCDGQSGTLSVALNSVAIMTCSVYTGISLAPGSFTMQPNPVYISSPPSSATITGSGISSTYGMPLVQYYTMDGTLAGQEQATSVSSDGTSMQIPGFGISQLPVGIYAGFISNAGPNGTWGYIGTGSVLVVNGSVQITGAEKSIWNCTAPQAGVVQTGSTQVTCPRLYDTGEVSVTVNGYTVTVPYGQNSTDSTIASAFAAGFNGDSNSPVNAFPYGPMIAFQKKSTTTESLSATSWTDDPGDFSGPSFHATPSGSSM